MRLTTLALCAVLATSGCGGGDDTGTSTGTPAPARQQASQAVTPRQAATLSTITMAESARQLMDEAEARFPTLFPGPQPTRSLPPFAYRYYPDTGNYVGVALASEGPYGSGYVYVLGASFGAEPVSVGPLYRFVNPRPQRVTVSLQNNSVVADLARGVFYASVPGSVAGQGNRIATIDATTGQVQYSGAVGLEPNAMALAADGSSLYVALDGSGEVVRLSLPGLQKLGTVRLPVDSFNGQTKVESLAASPTQAGTFAASLRYTDTSPRHAGVLLVRDMVAQPRQTPGHTGSNLIAFDPEGSLLYGLDTETSESGLRRIGLRSDGVEEESMVPAGTGYDVRALGVAGSTVVAGATLWTAPALLGSGTVPDSTDCRVRSAERLLCSTGTSSSPGLLAVDTATTATTAALALPATQNGATGTVIPGPGATVAWREPTRITLVRDEALR